MIGCHLEFECINYVAEYEVLIQGHRKTIDLKVKVIKVFGYSEIIARKIRNTSHHVPTHIKSCHRESWDFINHYEYFNINYVPRSQNFDTYLLANIASKLIPTEGFTPDDFSIYLI